jgi:hypothetical protein
LVVLLLDPDRLAVVGQVLGVRVDAFFPSVDILVLIVLVLTQVIIRSLAR